MLEVVFSNSVKGTVKAATRYNPEYYKDGPTAFFGRKPSEEEWKKMHEGEPIGGRAADVVQLGWQLDIGDISGDLVGDLRKEFHQVTMASMTIPEEHQAGMLEHSEGFWKELRIDKERIIKEATEGAVIRVWVDSTPQVNCGYAYLCDLLRHIDCDLRKVVLPEYWSKEENILIKGEGWHTIDAGQLYRFLKLEQAVPMIEKVMYGNLWQEMKRDKANLRAIVNGELMSVPDDFYDFLIMKELPDEPIIMGRLIARIFRYALGVADYWFSYRIDWMIKNGEIHVIGIHDGSHPYGRILKKAETG